jgi:hypothetical protein
MAEDPIIGSSQGLASASETGLEGCCELHEEGMHFIPLNLETSALAAGLASSTTEAPFPVAPDPLALWHPSPTTLV